MLKNRLTKLLKQFRMKQIIISYSILRLNKNYNFGAKNLQFTLSHVGEVTNFN